MTSAGHARPRSNAREIKICAELPPPSAAIVGKRAAPSVSTAMRRTALPGFPSAVSALALASDFCGVAHIACRLGDHGV